MKNTEIERKFLVLSDSYKALAASHSEIIQAYLICDEERSLRVRIRGEQAFITFKANLKDTAMARFEWEHGIPAEEARTLIGHALPGIIEKTRYLIEYEGHTWEVDEFHGNNEGLVLAEIELGIHAWQGDDVRGFESDSFTLTGGCQVTGNYPGRARNADELRADLDLALKLIPGRHRVGLQGHQVDRMFPGVDRDAFTADNFRSWIDWAKSKKSIWTILTLSTHSRKANQTPAASARHSS